MNNDQLRALYLTCRPKQWVKNLLVFIPPLFSLNSSIDIWITIIFSFICFCLVSSSIYIINDSLDFKEDRLHPIKKYRPIAAGLISIKVARFYAFLFLTVSFWFAFSISKYLFLVLFLYLIIQFLYCLKLKNKPIIDIFCISSGFLLRTLAGSGGSQIYLSPWFILTIGMLAFFIAVQKRKSELFQFRETGHLTRKVLEEYSMNLLLQMEALGSTSVFITYSLWAFGPTLEGASTNKMLLTIPFVLYGILRYQFLSNPNFKDDKKYNTKISCQNPEEILLNDSYIKLAIFLWLISSIIIISWF